MPEDGRLERVPQGSIYKYRPLRLDRSDLEGLLDIMKLSTGHKLDITADGYKLESPEDLQKIRKEVITDFKASLHTSHGRVSVDLSNSSAQVYVSDIRNNELTGIGQRIRDHLNKHGSSFAMKLSAFSVFWPFLLVVVLSGQLVLKSRLSFLIYFVAAGVLAAVWFAWSYHVDLRRHVVIYMTDAGRTSFFKRNRDQILVAVISALVGAALTVVVTLLIEALSH